MLMLWNEFAIAENWDAMAFTYQDIGDAFHEYILRIFRNGWIMIMI